MEGHEVARLALLAVLAALTKLQRPVVRPFHPQLKSLLSFPEASRIAAVPLRAAFVGHLSTFHESTHL